MSVSLSITKTQNPSVEGERIRSMTQYTPSEVEKIVKDEVTLSLEALLRAGARRMLQAVLEFEVETYLPACALHADRYRKLSGRER